MKQAIEELLLYLVGLSSIEQRLAMLAKILSFILARLSTSNFNFQERVFLKLILNLKIAEAPPLDFIQRHTFVIIHGIISF